ncbi:NAD(P)-dependent oxidoreductase [Enterocloster lavalensis]|uniref:NAD(P)-dependent oxidoreductase n=1 Tax=Enterocloster lavalensis TaxID=460384 RepID=UPI001D088ACB|nr:NAD(P)-dependent oxidoreductase [Enterocloster lavalensis]MCB6341347.1 NAD(P)-binding domain-containing protein [Enterocloster lavalensis]
MKHKEIRSIAGEDNPDMRAVQEQVRRFAEGLGCRYTWAPGAVGGENIDLAGAGALIVDGDEMNVRLADCSEAGVKVVVRRTGSWREGDLQRALSLGIRLAAVPENGEAEMAEMALSLILALRRKVIRHHQQVMEGQWIRHAASSVTGSTIGILGLENGGGKLAQMMEAMGCRVLVWQPDPENAEADSRFSAELEALCREADIVSVHLSYNQAGKQIVSKELIGWMKRTAVLISMGDGRLVDTEALYAALKEKRIEAAALDTLERTVIEGENPFRTLRNVILTPGIGRFTREELVRSGCEAVYIAFKLLSESDGFNTK